MPLDTVSLLIDTPTTIQKDVGQEMAKRACYCDRGILSCQYLPESNQLSVTLSSGAHLDGIKVKLDRLVGQMDSQRLAVEPKSLKSRSSGSKQLNDDLYHDLCACGDLTPTGTGVVDRSGDFLVILKKLDSLFQMLGERAFGARINDYSVLIPSDWLRKAGYFSSFPHSLTFATHLKEDLDQIEGFASRHKDGAELGFESLDELATPEFCLSPAVCYHTYGGMTQMVIPESANGLVVNTAANRCFRYESRNLTDLSRLWEFSMREIVFVGEKEEVLKARALAMDITWRLVEELDLDATLETASDPFFASDFKSLRFFQLANDLKFELTMPIGHDRSVAVGSFNYHEAFFGQSFDITTQDGEPAHTGCAAFGLERFVNALLAKHGMEESMRRLDAISENPQILFKEGSP